MLFTSTAQTVQRSSPSSVMLRLCLVIALLSRFTLDVLTGPMYVLCFGTDGHVAVEVAGHDHRANANSQAVPPTIDSKQRPVAQNFDPPCLDLPVTSDAKGTQASTDFAKALNGIAWVGMWLLSILLFIWLCPERISPSRSPPGPDSRVFLRRCVVLLI